MPTPITYVCIQAICIAMLANVCNGVGNRYNVIAIDDMKHSMTRIDNLLTVLTIPSFHTTATEPPARSRLAMQWLSCCRTPCGITDQQLCIAISKDVALLQPVPRQMNNVSPHLRVHAGMDHCFVADPMDTAPDDKNVAPVINWERVERELIAQFPLDVNDKVTSQVMAEMLIDFSETLSRILAVNRIDIPTHMIAQHSRGLVLVPFVGAAALHDVDKDAFYHHAMKLILEWHWDESRRSFADLLLDSIHPVKGTVECRELLINYLEIRDSVNIAWHLPAIILLLDLEEPLSDWIACPNSRGKVSLDYTAHIASAVKDWFGRVEKEPPPVIEEVINLGKIVSGIPRYVYAMSSSDDDKQIAEAIVDSIAFIDNNRESLERWESKIVAMMFVRTQVVRKHVDIDDIGVSNEMKEFVVQLQKAINGHK